MRDYAGKKNPLVFTLTYARPSALVFWTTLPQFWKTLCGMQVKPSTPEPLLQTGSKVLHAPCSFPMFVCWFCFVFLPSEKEEKGKGKGEGEGGGDTNRDKRFNYYADIMRELCRIWTSRFRKGMGQRMEIKWAVRSKLSSHTLRVHLLCGILCGTYKLREVIILCARVMIFFYYYAGCG